MIDDHHPEVHCPCACAAPLGWSLKEDPEEGGYASLSTLTRHSHSMRGKPRLATHQGTQEGPCSTLGGGGSLYYRMACAVCRGASENLNSTNRLSALPLHLFAWVTLHLCLAPHHQHHQPAACVRRTPPGTPAKPNATRHQRHRARLQSERGGNDERGHTRCGQVASSATQCHANASAHDT